MISLSGKHRMTPFAQHRDVGPGRLEPVLCAGMAGEVSERGTRIGDHCAPGDRARGSRSYGTSVMLRLWKLGVYGSLAVPPGAVRRVTNRIGRKASQRKILGELMGSVPQRSGGTSRLQSRNRRARRVGAWSSSPVGWALTPAHRTYRVEQVRSTSVVRADGRPTTQIHGSEAGSTRNEDTDHSRGTLRGERRMRPQPSCGVRLLAPQSRAIRRAPRNPVLSTDTRAPSVTYRLGRARIRPDTLTGRHWLSVGLERTRTAVERDSWYLTFHDHTGSRPPVRCVPHSVVEPADCWLPSEEAPSRTRAFRALPSRRLCKDEDATSLRECTSDRRSQSLGVHTRNRDLSFDIAFPRPAPDAATRSEHIPQCDARI